MTIDLYMMPASGPCRSVLMLLKQLNIPHNCKPLDLMKGEQNNPEFVAINPQHCVPTIVDTDTDFALWESRAILAYLCNKFAPDNALYPSDSQQRAIVDKMLYFDIGTLYKALSDAIYPVMFGCAKEIDAEKDKIFRAKLAFLDGFLAKSKYVAGDQLTIADLSILASVTFISVMDYDLSEFSNLTAWMKKLAEELPYNAEVNDEPLAGFRSWYEAKKATEAAAE